MRWVVRGVWQAIFATLAAPPAEALSDSTHIKGHLSEGGGYEHGEVFMGAQAQAIGCSRGGRNTKCHHERLPGVQICDPQGRPRVLCLTGGETHDIKPAIAMFDCVNPKVRVIADKAYDSQQLREHPAARGVKPMQ